MKQYEPKTPITKRRAAVVLSIVSGMMLALTALGVWCLRHYLADPALLRDYVESHYVLGAPFHQSKYTQMYIKIFFLIIHIVHLFCSFLKPDYS